MPTFIRLENYPDDRQSKEYGPFEYAQLTYDVLRVDDGETFAEYTANHRSQPRYWYLPDSDEPWSDIIIYAK